MDYEEHQTFGWVAYGTIAVVGAVSIGVYSMDEVYGSAWFPWAVAFTLGVVLFLVNLLGLRVQVTRDAVALRFGLVVPYFWKRIPIADIRGCEPVSFRPIRDSGGWGIRWGRLNGQSATFYTARGSRGVVLDTSKGLRVIGSQRPEALAEAIRAAMRATGSAE